MELVDGPTLAGLVDDVEMRLARADPTLGDNTFFHAYRCDGAAATEVAIFLSARAPNVSSALSLAEHPRDRNRGSDEADESAA